MPYVVCSVNPDGTVTTTTTIPDDLATATAYAAKNGGEVVSAAVAAALSRGTAPPPGGITVPEFKRRMVPALLGLGLKDDATQRKWDRVLTLLDSFTVVYPAVSPMKDLIAEAIKDKLLTPEQAAALAAG